MKTLVQVNRMNLKHLRQFIIGCLLPWRKLYNCYAYSMIYYGVWAATMSICIIMASKSMCGN